MRIVLFLTVLTITQALTATALAKTTKNVRTVAEAPAGEKLTCWPTTPSSAQYEIPNCRSDRAVAVYPNGTGNVEICCVK